MSGYRGVALVTETVRHLLTHAATGAVEQAEVRVGSPDGMTLADPPMINIFLYAVAPSAYGSNDDLPTRAADGSLMAARTTVLELDYLFGIMGRPDTLDAERLLGAVMSAFDGGLILRETAAAALDAANQVEATGLAVDDLIYPVESSVLSHTMEERINLCSALQTAGRLSVAYRVRATVQRPEPELPQVMRVSAPEPR